MNHSPVCSRAKNQVTGSAISIHVSQTNQRKSLKLHSYNSSIHQLLSKPKTKPQKSLSSLSHAIYLYHGLLTSYSSMNWPWLLLLLYVLGHRSSFSFSSLCWFMPQRQQFLLPLNPQLLLPADPEWKMQSISVYIMGRASKSSEMEEMERATFLSRCSLASQPYSTICYFISLNVTNGLVLPKYMQHCTG